MITFEEFQSSRKECDDLFSSISDPDEFGIEESDFITNVGFIYESVNEDFPPYVEKVEHGFFVQDGSTMGNTYQTLEEAEHALYEHLNGEGLLP